MSQEKWNYFFLYNFQVSSVFIPIPYFFRSPFFERWKPRRVRCSVVIDWISHVSSKISKDILTWRASWESVDLETRTRSLDAILRCFHFGQKQDCLKTHFLRDLLTHDGIIMSKRKKRKNLSEINQKKKEKEKTKDEKHVWQIQRKDELQEQIISLKFRVDILQGIPRWRFHKRRHVLQT